MEEARLIEVKVAIRYRLVVWIYHKARPVRVIQQIGARPPEGKAMMRGSETAICSSRPSQQH
jgi:hypothetical protein